MCFIVFVVGVIVLGYVLEMVLTLTIEWMMLMDIENHILLGQLCMLKDYVINVYVTEMATDYNFWFICVCVFVYLFILFQHQHQSESIQIVK